MGWKQTLMCPYSWAKKGGLVRERERKKQKLEFSPLVLSLCHLLHFSWQRPHKSISSSSSCSSRSSRRFDSPQLPLYAPCNPFSLSQTSIPSALCSRSLHLRLYRYDFSPLLLFFSFFLWFLIRFYCFCWWVLRKLCLVDNSWCYRWWVDHDFSIHEENSPFC